MKTFKKYFLFLLMLATSFSFVSCGSDDDTNVDLASVVSGSYSGTLKPMGYSDDPAKCYITITRLSNDAARIERVICEEFDMDMTAVNVTVTDQGNGKFYLRSETSKSIEGTYYQGQLTLSFSTSLATFFFSGSKD